MPLNIPGILVPFQLLFNPRLILPSLTKDIRHIDFGALKKAGYRGAVFDKDNCLTLPHKDGLVPELQDAWEECLRTFGDGNVLIVSNSAGSKADPGGIQAESVKRKLHAPVLFHNTPKPGYACIASIRRYFSSLQHPVQAEQLIIVGDRVFTDVVLANRLRALDRGSGLVHMCCRTVFERGGTVGREKDEASRQRSEESGPLAIWTTGVWQREAMVMRWCEKRLVAAVRRWTSQNETQGLNSPFLKDLPPTAVRARSWKWWQS